MLNFFLVAGISYLFFLLTMADTNQTITAYIPWLYLLFSFPHFMSTYWVWASRVKKWKNEWPVVSFPVIYIAIFVLAAKGHLGPQAVEILVKVTYLYLLYHFAQQLYGVTLWLNLQHGITYSQNRKRLLRSFFLAAGLYAWLEMEMRGVANILFYHSVSSWGLSAEYITAGFILVFGLSILNIFFCFYDFFKFKKLNFLISIASMGLAWLWLLPPLNINMVMLLPVLHGIQYLPFLKIKSRNLTPLRGLTLIVLWVASGWFFFRWVPFYFPLTTLEGTLWPALILTLLNNHHFLIDGRIWKLRDVQNQDLI